MLQRFLKHNTVFLDPHRADASGMSVTYDITGKYDESFQFSQTYYKQS